MLTVRHVRFLHVLWTGVKLVILALCIVLPIRFFIAQPFIVSGPSMEPALQSHDYVIIDEISYYIHPPRRGDVLIFKYPLDPDVLFVKRLIGLPGETVAIRDGSVVISKDGHEEVLDEPYVVNHSAQESFAPITLTDKEYFVLGDNRSESSDSRTWGPLTKQFFVGRAIVRLYPLSKVTLFPGQHTF